MAKYECKICGYVFDEQQAGETFDNLYSCPICDADKSAFELIEADENKEDGFDDEDDFVFEEADEETAELNSEEKEENNEVNSEAEDEGPKFESLFTKANEFSSAEEENTSDRCRVNLPADFRSDTKVLELNLSI